MEIISLEQIIADYPEKFVVAVIAERDKRNFASKFYVLHSTINKVRARVVLNKLLSDGVDSVLIPTFKEKRVLMVRQLGETDILFEPTQTHKEVAQFFRHYYNINN